MSSLYTNRILSEHPVASWPMDDGASFLSLITEAQRDMTTGWSGTNLATSAGPSIAKPFEDSGIWKIEHSSTGSTAAGETITATLSSVFSATDVYGSTDIAASAFFFIETVGTVLSIDIGSSATIGNFTTNYIDPETVDTWVKVESSNLKASDGDIFIRFNLAEGADREGIILYINGLVVGQYSEPYSSSALGVQSSKIGPYIKAVGVDLEATVDDFASVSIAINDANVNAITVPIKIDIAATTSDAVSLDVDSDSYVMAKRIYANFSSHKNIILEPYAWINSGANDPDELDPATPADWFASWQEALLQIVSDMPDAYGIYCGSGFELIEDEADEWLDLMDAIRLAFRGQIMYKTKWWITDSGTPSTYTDYENNKLNLGLWAGVDIISISSFFELTTTDDPSQAQIETALRSTDVSSRAQDVYQEIINFWDTWSKPILLGDLTCPALDDGAYHPWDEAVSAVANADIQSDLLAAYQTVFGSSDGYIGFSVPYAGTSNDYALESSAVAYLAALDNAPVNNAFVEFAAAESVGVGDYNAYYCAAENRLAAYATGIPIVYGADKYTRLRSVGGDTVQPSFVFDGQRAFNVTGTNQDYTIEFWMRIHGYTVEDRKLFGPLETQDGLYVNGGTLTIVYGDDIASANIGVLHHPMLVTIRLHTGAMDLAINGDVVASIQAQRGSIPLQNASNPYLGFFCYPDIEPVDIDSVTVFAYSQPSVLAKRHFAWAQAVDSTESHNLRFRGSSIEPSFPHVKPVKNISYPNTFNWNAGVSHNLEIVDSRLKTIQRPLPDIVLYSKSEDDFYDDNKLVQTVSDPYFTFRPSASWSTEPAMFHFSSLEDYCDNTKAFSFIWSTDTVVGEETLAIVRSRQDNLRYIRFYRDASDIKVQFVSNDTITELQTISISADNKYISFIDFTQTGYAAVAPIEMRALLKSLSDLEILLGSDGSSTFTGKLYRVSFYDSYTAGTATYGLSDYVTETVDYAALSGDDKITYAKASYSMIPQYKYGSFFADVEQVGYWEDYIPLTTMAGFVDDIYGNQKATVDQIQFNIGTPRPSLVNVYPPTYAMLTEVYGLLGETYEEFMDDFEAVQYQDFYLTYSTFITDSLEIRSFVSFQDQSQELLSLTELGNEFPPTTTNTVYYDALGVGLGDRIEVIDGTTIVAPKSKRIDNLVLSVHLEFVSRNSYTRPVSVKTMELASYAFNKNTFTEFGSKTGSPVYPFVTNLVNYSHTVSNPLRIGKRSHGPLYLGRETGFTPVGVRSEGLERGLMATIPQAATNSLYELAAIQFWVCVDDVFPEVGDKVFEFIDGSTQISFIVSEIFESDAFARLRVIDENGDPFIAGNLFQNGDYVLSLHLHKSEWTSIALYLDDPILFESLSPKLKMYPGASYMNVSYFQPDDTLIQSLLSRQWLEIDNEYWEYWTYGSSFESGISSWQNMLFPGDVVTSESELPVKLFRSYVGQNAVDITPDSSLDVAQGQVYIYKDVLSARYTQQPS